jgi:hypothetical protein
MTVFWVIAPCSLLGQAIALTMEEAGTSEMYVSFYQTTRRDNPDDSHLRTCHRENLKSHQGELCFW